MKFMNHNNRHMKKWCQFVWINYKIFMCLSSSKWEHKNFCSYCRNKSLYVNQILVYNSCSWISFPFLELLHSNFDHDISIEALVFVLCCVSECHNIIILQELHQKSVNWKFDIGLENNFEYWTKPGDRHTHVWDQAVYWVTIHICN